jgi:hypothetical protein
MLKQGQLEKADLMNPVTLIFIGLIIGLIIWGLKQGQLSRGGISPALLRAAKGDRKLVQRLIEGTRLRHPGKSDRWYQEKVLYDIERDGAGSSGRGRRF